MGKPFPVLSRETLSRKAKGANLPKGNISVGRGKENNPLTNFARKIGSNILARLTNAENISKYLRDKITERKLRRKIS
jgi:hypothetical protein